MSPRPDSSTDSSPPFYVSGGTLPPGAPSYVPRRADELLLDALVRGEFCYLLDTRQIGKSSLMVRAAARLRARNTRVALLDLTRIGQPANAEQWYYGLLLDLGAQLGLRDEMRAFWQGSKEIGPLQRWVEALRQVALPADPDTPLVLFVDEIDNVLNLPFSTDEFFAGIRECYTRRADDPQMGRLTFCLLGSALPDTLIRDVRTTPFNVGTRIEPTDFTAKEAAPLAAGLGRGGRDGVKLLRRILYWTGGHPYLTQRLCAAVAAHPSVTRPGGVDRLCESLFFSQSAREGESNLTFVGSRLLRSTPDLAGLLDTYGHVRARGLGRGRGIKDDPTNALHHVLRLSGVVRVVEGYLWVRNRIYFRVFDREWVRAHVPDAEARRQRAAFRRGALRAVAAAGVIIVALACLVALLVSSRDATRRALASAQLQRDEKGLLLFSEDVRLAKIAYDANDLQRTLDLLNECRHSGDTDYGHRFEWRYLWHLCHGELRTFVMAHSVNEANGVVTVAFTPSGGALAAVNGETASLWDVATGQRIKSMGLGLSNGIAVSAAAFSSDCRRLAIAESTHVTIFNFVTGRPDCQFQGNDIVTLGFAQGGKVLATCDRQGNANLWNAATGRHLRGFEHHGGESVNAAVLSQDGRLLATGGVNGELRLWDLTLGRSVFQAKTLDGEISHIAVSPDEKTLVTVSHDGAVQIWTVSTGPSRKIKTPAGSVISIALSPDGRILMTGNADNSLSFWDAAGGHIIRPPVRGHLTIIPCAAFSPDGRTLATGGYDNLVKLWDAAPPPAHFKLPAATGGPIGQVECSADQNTAAWMQGNNVSVANVASRRVLWTLGVPSQTQTALSPDGGTLATVQGDGFVRVWDTLKGDLINKIPCDSGVVSEPALAFSQDRATLAIAGQRNALTLWNWKTGKPSGQTIPFEAGKRASISNACFSPDGTHIAAAVVYNSGTRIEIWEARTGSRIRQIDSGEAFIFGIAFSPDGRSLATMSSDKPQKLNLWDVAAGQPRWTVELGGPTSSSFALAFSPDGQTLAIIREDKIVQIWDVSHGRETLTLPTTDPVLWLAFDHTGRTLLALDEAGRLQSWQAADYDAMSDQL